MRRPPGSRASLSEPLPTPDLKARPATNPSQPSSTPLLQGPARQTPPGLGCPGVSVPTRWRSAHVEMWFDQPAEGLNFHSSRCFSHFYPHSSPPPALIANHCMCSWENLRLHFLVSYLIHHIFLLLLSTMFF